MAKAEWGIKRICHNCGARYYDLLHDPIVCPACGTEYDPDAFLRSRRTRSAVVDEPAPRPVPRKAPPAEEPEELEEAALEDASSEEAGIEAEDGEALETLETGEDDFSEEDTAEQEMLEDASELGDDEDVSIDVDQGEDEER